MTILSLIEALLRDAYRPGQIWRVARTRRPLPGGQNVAIVWEAFVEVCGRASQARVRTDGMGNEEDRGDAACGQSNA